MNTQHWYQVLSGKYDESGNQVNAEPVLPKPVKRPRRKSLKHLDAVDKAFNTFEKWVNKNKDLVL